MKGQWALLEAANCRFNADQWKSLDTLQGLLIWIGPNDPQSNWAWVEVLSLCVSLSAIGVDPSGLTMSSDHGHNNNDRRKRWWGWAEVRKKKKVLLLLNWCSITLLLVLSRLHFKSALTLFCSDFFGRDQNCIESQHKKANVFILHCKSAEITCLEDKDFKEMLFKIITDSWFMQT